jgi:pimeloyl-ACP methyl ester carboxylesterase
MSATSEPGGLQRTSLGGRALAYRTRGSAGAPVVYLAGAAGEGTGAALDALADAYRLYLPERPDGLAPADAAALLGDFVRAVVPEGKAHLVGVSAGATVALWVALQQPTVVERVVVVAPTTCAPDAAADAALSGRDDPRVVPPAREDAPVELSGRDDAPPPMAGRDDALAARLAEIEAPVLALFGTEDALLGAAVPRLYRARLPHGQVTLVYRAGHDVAADRPAAVARLVDEFLTYGEGFVRNHGSTGYMRAPEGKAPSGRALAGRPGAGR